MEIKAVVSVVLQNIIIVHTKHVYDLCDMYYDTCIMASCMLQLIIATYYQLCAVLWYGHRI